MAKRRCLSSAIVGSGAFAALPPRTQAVYIQLQFIADDDGVVDNERAALANVSGANMKDVQALIDARFLLRCGRVLVIKHWWVHNTRRPDRHHPTQWRLDLAGLYVRPDKVYTDHEGAGNHLYFG